jgi:ubiquinone/menaquinone biosynthesis C-methylase UbiE
VKIRLHLTRPEFLESLKLSPEEEKEMIDYETRLEMFQYSAFESRGVKRGHVIIDAGTGDQATLAFVLSMIVEKDGMVVAVDKLSSALISSKDIIGFRSKYSETPYSSIISLLRTDLRKLGIRPKSVDMTASWNLLCFIERKHWNEAVEELLRALKLGGKVIVLERLVEHRCLNKAQRLYSSVIKVLDRIERDFGVKPWFVRWKELLQFLNDYGPDEIKILYPTEPIIIPKPECKWFVQLMRSKLDSKKAFMEPEELQKIEKTIDDLELKLLNCQVENPPYFIGVLTRTS